MNTLNGYSKSTLTDHNVLTASGGHIPLELLHITPYRSSFELYDTLPMLLSGKLLGNNCLIVNAGENTAPHSKVYKVVGPCEFYSPETMNFTPGETICIESWIMRPSGATDTAGKAATYYLGINFRDKLGKPINSNNGCIYFGESTAWTCPCDGVWHRRYNEYTIPTTHTAYNGSDGGGFFSGTVRCLINYGGGTIPTYYGGFRIYKKNININANSATNVYVNHHTTNDIEYPLVWSNQTNTNNIQSNLLYKSYSHLTYNPNKQRISVNNLWSLSGVLTLNGTNIYLKYNNTDTTSVVLNNSAFKPFEVATEKLDLGTSSARWKGLYTVTGNFNNKIVISNSGEIKPYNTDIRSAGMYGEYDNSKIGHVWSIGTTYKIADDGSNAGNAYGLIYFYTNWSNSATYNTATDDEGNLINAIGEYAKGHQIALVNNGKILSSLGQFVWSKYGFKKEGSSNSYVLLGGGSHKALSDFATASGVVTALGTNGNYVTWTKNGTVNNLTVPYATTAGSANSVAWNNITNKPNIFTKIGGQSVDFNFEDDNDNNGLYYLHDNYTQSNKNGISYGSLMNFSCSASSWQLISSFSSKLYYRQRWWSGGGGSWSDWVLIAFTSDIPTTMAWSNITSKPSFATVATSGSYNDLSNKPTIPTSLPANGGTASKSEYLLCNALTSTAVFGLPHYGYTTLNEEFGTTGTDTTVYLQNYIKKLIKTHNSLSSKVGIGSINPNSSQLALFRAYTLSDYNSTGLPLYCTGFSVDVGGYAYVWGTLNGTWFKYSLVSDKNVNNYYWANVRLSTSSNDETTPTFSTATTKTKLTTPLVSSTGRLTLNATSTSVDLKFNNDNTKSVILNGAAFKPFDDANNKLTLGSSSARWSELYSVKGNFTGLVKINGTAASQPLLVRNVTGQDGTGSVVGELYLQYGANKAIMLGNTGAHSISADGSLYTGNAASATKLQTARTLTIGNSAKTFDGSANVSWSLHDILYSGTNIGTSTSWDISDPGVYYVAAGSAFTGTNNPEATNGGLTPYRYGLLIVSRAGNGGIAQFYISHNDSSNSHQYGIKFRTGWNSTYLSTWNSLLDSSNYTEYTVKKDGTGASGDWGINISGGAKYVFDYNATTTPIYIGFASTGLTSATASHLAAYGTTSSGARCIKDISAAEAKKFIGLGNVDNTADANKSVNYATNAGSANKLTNARTIAISEGAIGTATSFNGTANITIPVTSIKEAYLTWGGKNHLASFGPIDASLVGCLGANRFDCLPAECITIEYSRDAGATWIDYGATDSNKINLVSQSQDQPPFYLGKKDADTTLTKDFRLRVIINSKASNNNGVYSTLNKFIIYVGNSDTSYLNKCTIKARTLANYSSNTNTWVTIVSDVRVDGWSGYNVINTTGVTTYGNRDNQYREILFEFKIDAPPTSGYGFALLKLFAFGGVGWQTPSNMAKHGHLYNYDSAQKAVFPAKVQASEFIGNLSGVASNITVSNSDVNNTYKLVFHSGNALLSTGGIYCNPSTDTLYSTKVIATNFTSNVATGTQPYACASTTLNTNLNADMLDGKHASDFAETSHSHSYLPLSGGTLTGALTISSNNWGNQLILNRTNNGSNWGPSILFNIDGTNNGALTMTSNQLYVGNNGGTRYKVWNEGNDGSESGLDADLLDGLHLNSSTRNNEANKVMRTDGSGYANFGWINTTSGTASGTITRIYCSQDSYVRYLAPADVSVGNATNWSRCLSWSSPTKVNTWSKVLKINNNANILLTINFSLNSLSSSHMYLINTGWNCSRIVQLGGNGYSSNYDILIRVTQAANSEHHVEIYNTFGYEGRTDVSFNCRAINMGTSSTITGYTTYTLGTGTDSEGNSTVKDSLISHHTISRNLAIDRLECIEILSTSTYNTVAKVKTRLEDIWNTVGRSVGSYVVVSSTAVNNWDTNTATVSSSSSYAMIKIGGAYEGNDYGLWLLSTYGDNKIGYVGRSGDTWTNIKWLATTDLLDPLYTSNIIMGTSSNNFGQFSYTGSDLSRHTNLTLGNNIAYNTSGKAWGSLKIYGRGTGATTIRRDNEITGDHINTSYSLFLPKATGEIVHHPLGTKIGSETHPVYINEKGLAVACNNPVLKTVENTCTITYNLENCLFDIEQNSSYLMHISIRNDHFIGACNCLLTYDRADYNIIVLSKTGFGSFNSFKINTKRETSSPYIVKLSFYLIPDSNPNHSESIQMYIRLIELGEVRNDITLYSSHHNYTWTGQTGTSFTIH